MRPLITDSELLAVVNSIVSEEEMADWYPVSILIDLFDIAEKNNVVEILAGAAAMGVLKDMLGKLGVDTPKKALMTLATSYKHQHRGMAGEFKIDMLSETKAAVIDSTYAPCGYLGSLCKMSIAGFGAKNVEMNHIPEQCKNKNSKDCKLIMSWLEDENLKLRRRTQKQQ